MEAVPAGSLECHPVCTLICILSLLLEPEHPTKLELTLRENGAHHEARENQVQGVLADGWIAAHIPFWSVSVLLACTAASCIFSWRS